jgi:hypothetical protein
MTHITDSDQAVPARASRGRIVSLLLLAFCALVLAAGTARLAVVTAATPSGLWLVEYPPLLPAAGTVDAATSDRARWVSRYLADPRLATALLGPCTDARGAAEQSGDLLALQAATQACFVLVEEALVSAPLAGELWLQKALLQFALGDFPGFEESLRASYRTAPREGWIAARRAPLGVTTFEQLPADLKPLVMGDLALLLTHKSLADSFVALFVADEGFRSLALPLVEALPAADQETFLGFVSAAGGR